MTIHASSPRALSFVSLKGGVAKTTNSANLAAVLADRGHRVLALDLDPQGGLTASLGMNAHRPQTPLGFLLCEDDQQDIEQAMVPCLTDRVDDRLWGIPAGRHLTMAEMAITSDSGGEYRLRDLLALIDDGWDWIIIDTPPNLGKLTYSALLACTEVVICAEPSVLAYNNLDDAIKLVGKANQNGTSSLHLWGVLLARVHERRVITRDMRHWIADAGIPLLDISIPYLQRIADAPYEGVPISLSQPGGLPAARYQQLADLLTADRAMEVQAA